MKKLLIIITVLLSTLLLSAQEQQAVPYTLADRDRLSRIESKIEILSNEIMSLEEKMDVKFETVNERIDLMNESLNGRIDSMNERIDSGDSGIHSRIDSLFWMMGIIAAFMIFLLGYTIWDRRTALKPALDSASRTEDKNKNLINALREYARNHPDLAEILRTHGLL